MSSGLLNTLFQLLDDIHELNKQMYKLEHEARDDKASIEYLESAVSNAQFTKDLLRINITNFILDREGTE